MSQFDDLKLQILHDIWKVAYQPKSISGFDLDNVDVILSQTNLSGATRAAIHALRDEDFLEFSGVSYHITQNGIRYVEMELNDPDSRISELIRGSAIDDDTRPLLDELSVPASDRIVTLDHNGDPYKQAIHDLDAALNAFKEDHGLDNSWGQEKSILQHAIEGGRQLLDQLEVRAATIFTTIVMPFKIVCQKYQDAIAEGMAKAAADQVIHLAGKAIVSILTLLGLK